MNEVSIIAKIIIALIFLVMFAIGAFLGGRVLGLMKRVKQVQDDRNKAMEDWYRLLRAKPMLEELEKKMMLNALNMPEYKKAIDEPSTHHHVRKTYGLLKKKIKDSIDV